MNNAREVVSMVLELEVVEHPSDQRGTGMIRSDIVKPPVYVNFPLNVRCITTTEFQDNIVMVPG